MSALTGKSPASTFKDLLQVSNGNQGIDATLRVVEDGEGTQSPLFLSTTEVKIKGGDGVFEVVDSFGNTIFIINTTTKEVTAGSGVKFVGDGSSLSGITGATGGVSNTGSTNIVADSDADGSGDITLSIGFTEIARIANNGSGNGGSFVLKSLNEDALATLTGGDIALANIGGKAYVQDADGIHGVVLEDKYSDPKGGYIFDGSDDKVPIKDQDGIQSLALTVVLDDTASVALGTLGSNLEIQIVSGIVTLGSGFTNTTIYVDNQETSEITTGKHFIQIDFDEVSAFGGYWGYDGSNYGAFTLLRPELFNMKSIDYNTQLYNNGKSEEAVIPYELQGASMHDFYNGAGDFSSSDGWHLTPEASISSGQLTFTADGNRQYAWHSLSPAGKANKKFVMKYEVVSNSLSGNGEFRIMGTGLSSSQSLVDTPIVLDASVGTHTTAPFLSRSNSTREVEGIEITDGYTSGTLVIDNVEIIEVGNVLDLKPSNAGSNAWVGELEGEIIEANTTGSPTAMGNLRDGRNGVSTTEVILTDTHKAGHLLEGIITYDKSGSANTITIGTTSGGNDIANAVPISANSNIYISVNQYTDTDRSLYATAGASSVDLVLIYKKIK